MKELMPKESVLDVLLYLFENYAEPKHEPLDNLIVLRSELQDAGFHHRAVDKAIDWLEQLGELKDIPLPASASSPAMRILNRRELNRFDTETIGFLLELENASIITPNQRELILDRLLALNVEIGIDQIRWVTLMVLSLSDEDEKTNSPYVDHLTFDYGPITLH